MAPPAEKPIGYCLVTPEVQTYTKAAAPVAVKGGKAGGGKVRKKGPILTEEENVVRGTEVFAAMGELLFKKNFYREAMTPMDIAIELDEKQEHTRVYLVRAAALIKLGRYSEALKELDKAGEPKSTTALVLLTQAYWFSGEFEKAAVTSSRGVRKGCKKPLFREMLNTSLGSIERCIGPSAGEILVQVSNDIFKMEEEKIKKADWDKQFRRKSSGRMSNRDRRCQVLRRQLKMYQMQVHMGRLAVDSRYISNLNQNPGFASPNAKGMQRMNLLIDCNKSEMMTRLLKRFSRALCSAK